MNGITSQQVVVTLRSSQEATEILNSNVFIQWAEADQVFFIFKFAAVVAAIWSVRGKQAAKCGIIQWQQT